MGEPLARMDLGGEGVLGDATRRLERALQALEARVAKPSEELTARGDAALLVELQSVRERGRELEHAAAEASQALARAAAEVERALVEDEGEALDAQTSLFDAGLLDSSLESGPVLPDEEERQADRSAAHEEPTA